MPVDGAAARHTAGGDNLLYLPASRGDMSDRTHDAVFWDVGGVILDIDTIMRGQRAFVERAVTEYDLDVPVDEAIRIWQEAMREHFTGREDGEYRTAREGRRKAAEALFGDPPDDWRELHETVTGEHTETTPGAVETIRALHDGGVYQAIVSDADEGGIPEMLDRFGIRDCITHVTTSEEVGYTKPDQRMFEMAFEKAREADIDPLRGVMVGDKYRNDMEGGKKAGLTTVSHGADDGPAVDHHVDDLRELLDIVGVDRP